MPDSITLKIDTDAKEFSLPWTEGMNVQDALEAAHGIAPGIDFSITYYGPRLGYMVTEIDGIPDADPKYWFFNVNGTPSPHGIDFETLRPDDVVEFLFASYDPAQHPGKLASAKKIRPMGAG